MPEALRRELARPGVHALGRVARLADVFERVRLTVAPLRFGAGLKDKVVRSMGAGVPCVGTSEAFEGMPQLPRLLQQDCIRDTAHALAAAIVRMHRDEACNAGCAAAGLAYVAATYNQPRIDALMREPRSRRFAAIAPTVTVRPHPQ